MNNDTINPSAFAETAARLIADVTGDIKFPVMDDEFDGILDDCIDAMDGRDLPAHYSVDGFDLPDIPSDGYYLLMALHYLMDAIDERHIELSDDIRSRVDAFWKGNGIVFDWDRERFIVKAFFPLDEDRISALKEYQNDLERDIEDSTEENRKSLLCKLDHLKNTISKFSAQKREDKAPSGVEVLKLLIAANGGKDFTQGQLADFNDDDDENDA